MKATHYLAAAVAGLSVAAASSASAAIVLDYTPFSFSGANLDYALHNTGDATGTTVQLDVQGEPFLVNLTSVSSLDQGGNGGGFAIVNGTPTFDELLITPDNFAGFTAFQFDIEGQNKLPGSNANIQYGTFDLGYTLLGGSLGSLFVNIPTNTKVRLYGDAGEVFTSLTLSNLQGTRQGQAVAADFATIRQMSFNAAPGAVPEPATWAMMLTGFFGLGGVLRGRKANALGIQPA